MDVHSKEIRSYNMSRIKSKDTTLEISVRKYLFSKGFRYRTNDKRYPGKPDIVLPKYNTVIFINGCFWHMHSNCVDFSFPKTNIEFWRKKLQMNKQHDEDVVQQLHNMNWNVIVLWQCELKREKFNNTMQELEKILKNNERSK